MAKVYPDLAGGYSGNVGKSSYFRREGDTFVRTIPTPKKEASDAQIAQWLRMEMLGQIGSCLSEAVKVGFPVVRRKMWSPFNMFINKNKDIVTVDGLIAFAESEAGAAVFGDNAPNVAEHGRQIKAQGAVYCDCPACAVVEAILAKKGELL